MSSLLQRLKERKLAQWALAYLAGAWVALQVLELVGGQFDWPVEMRRSITVIVGIGFFAALVLAWYHGERGSQRVTSMEILMLAALFVIAGGVLAFVGPDEERSGSADGPAAALADVDPRSVAVLPFENLSRDTADMYFSDGITEDIITQLSKVSDLVVISRTSTMQYRTHVKSLRVIGQELGVATILEGSVRRVGDRVRINAQLIDSKTDRHLWAETYDRELRDVFAIQTEIAHQIVAALKARLSAGERARLTSERAIAVSAYDYYLRGRELIGTVRKDDNATAIELFRRAIAIDSTYADAHAGLAVAYGNGFLYFDQPAAWVDSVRVAAARAVRLDANLGEAYMALGLAYALKGWQQRAFEAQYKAASLNPGSAAITGAMSRRYAGVGELADAVRWSRKALLLDPRNAREYLWLGRYLSTLGYDDEAEQAFRTSLEFQPDNPDAVAGLVYLHAARGDRPRARETLDRLDGLARANTSALGIFCLAAIWLAEIERARSACEAAWRGAPADTWRSQRAAIFYAYVLQKSGVTARADSLLDGVLQEHMARVRGGDGRADVRYQLAQIHALRNDNRAAAEWLKKSLRGAGLSSLGYGRDATTVRPRASAALDDPLLANLRGMPEFTAILAEARKLATHQRQLLENTPTGG
ncbi:MAG: tetratricopeptide repeat protein [Gemmatimonadota bacterium]